MQANSDSTTNQLQPVATLRQSLLLITIGYLVVLLIVIGAILLILRSGATLTAPVAATTAVVTTTVAKSEPLLHLLIALIAVIVTGLALGKLFAFLGQPPVIGEVVAGIVLGPSLLGPERSAYLGIIAHLGVLLYMFTVGLELHVDVIKRRAHTTLVTAQASIALPLVLGTLLALLLYPRLATQVVTFTSFALFLGVAMSITAFPVLARILTDRGLHKTDLGILALSCAAIGDVTAWCLLLRCLMPHCHLAPVPVPGPTVHRWA